MARPTTFLDLLWSVIRPTGLQVLLALVVSTALLAGSQTSVLLPKLGITPQAIAVSQDKFHGRFDAILRSGVAANLALMTFWATVGLVAYLICWGLYNLLIEARNEVTLTTAYTNRGHWHGPWETLAVKAVAGTGLALILSTFWSLASIWIALAAGAISDPTATTVAYGAAAVIGLAVQLYAVLVFIQLTFTPWYRAESFTE